MEQFKQLKWSWNKYEEDKNYLPRKFSFETINDNDALSRTLNEIHTCVIPQQSEYRIFKTPEEIAANHFELDTSGQVIELKDPRKNSYCMLESSHAMIKEYSYSSELKKHEHLSILKFLTNDTIHNKKLLKNVGALEKSYDELPNQVLEKWQKEVDHFNRCAEIYYHRHITQFNNLICEKFKELLINKWKKLEVQFPYANYQVITMIVRNNSFKSDPIDISHLESLPINFDKKLYTLPSDHFPIIQKVSTDGMKLFLQSREIFIRDNEVTEKSDIQISLDVLTKLFIDGTEFNVNFKNENNCTKFWLNEVLPFKTVANNYDALEEIVKEIIIYDIEWSNASKCVQSSAKSIDYKLYSINETMSKIFKNYKRHAGINNEISLWRLEKCPQKLSICVNANRYFMDDDTKVIISIKFEFQTNFGAEQMTREELLKEWIQLKFSLNSIVMRYRIDVRSLEILSVNRLKIEDIERELKEIYNYDPLNALDTLLNVFSCIRNLPEANYIIQAQHNDADCNKLLIYKEAFENGKNIMSDEDFRISEKFTRKWILIDKNIVTFLHINEQIAPCCFSYTPSQKISYIMPTTKKVITKKIVQHKSPQKAQIVRKKSKAKNKNKKKKQRKATIVKNLKNKE